VHEQIHKALDRKVWLASGGSLIIERTEALTVIDVNTGKNVGTSNLEETVFRNNLEAAEEIARQLRLRDIGGIIVIDFIDMEITANRSEVIKTFRAALARDKTRTQVFEISELGLVEMTRKRISEGLVESFSETCPTCGGRGIIFDQSLLL
jgi:ribonuclease E